MTETRGGADVLTPHAMVILQDRPIVPLTPAISEALVECENTDRTLQVVTSPDSRLTLPLRDSKAHWLVHADNAYYEGLTGRPMQWNGTAFVPVPEARDYAPTYTTRPTAPVGSHLVLTLQARHASDGVLGAHTEKLMRLLTGEPPKGWCSTEPLQHPWNPEELTTHATDTSPSRLIAVGAGTRPAMATMAFSPLVPPTGTAEQTTLTIGYAEDEDPPIPQLPSFVDLLSAEQPITALLAQLVPGRTDLTVEPRWTGQSAPIGLASAGAYTGPPGFSRKRLGPPNAPLTWFNLGDGYSPDYWQRHRDLLAHLRRTP